MSRSNEGWDRRNFLKGAAAGAAGLGLSATWGRTVLGEEDAAAGAELVKRRVLGRTGREVSCVAFGGGGLRPDRSALLQAAYRKGIDFFDTAWGYGQGQSELGVGAFLETLADREKVFVNTKASGFRPPRGSAAAVHTAFREQVLASLGRMKSEYVDCLMWPHGATSPAMLENPAMRESMQKLQEEGLVRFFGASSHSNYPETLSAAVESGFYDVVLSVVNVCTQNAAEAAEPESEGRRQRGRGVEDTSGLLAKAKEHDVGLMVMKAANPGFLTPATDALLAAKQAEAPAAWSRHQKLYAYALGLEGVSTVVVGIGSVNHLKEAVEVGAA